MHSIVTTVLKAQCQYARGEYTTVNKGPLCFTIDNLKPCKFYYESCENWQKKLLRIACNLPNSLKFFATKVFYYTVHMLAQVLI